MNDIAGPRIAFDQMYAGEEGMVSADLTRWNEPVYQSISSRPDPIAGARGTDRNLYRGTMMLHENVAYDLWVQYPASALAAYATLPAGYHFFKAFLEGPDQLSPGVRPYKVRTIFHCLAFYSPADGNFSLYDHNMAGIPNPD
jgi:hypothetical protein